ncbi:MAG: hypothetical protein CSA53_08180, partial [Gammaproteobacteria bacterium]
ADDTDIFFGTNSNLDVYPNVLLIVDTSGSMNWQTNPPSNNNRIGHVKEALRILINDLNNVNVGLMRFSNPGGPVLYPVSPIDGDVVGGGNVAVVASVADSSDDAMEAVTSSATVFQNDSQRLYLPKTQQFGVSTDVISVNNDNGDSRERISDGHNWTGSTELDFLHDNDYMIGLRFGNTNVPPNAQILDARVELFGRDNPSNNSDPVFVQIVGERDETGGNYENINRHLFNRIDEPSERTVAVVNWTLTDEVEHRMPMQSADVSSIVQQIVDNPAWNAPSGEEDDVSLMLAPQSGAPDTGRRFFYSRNGNPNFAPRLVVDYLNPGVPNSEVDSQVGVRFQNVRVP